MATVTKLPLKREVDIYSLRDTLLLHIQSKTTAGVANDLSSYTFRGKVKASIDSTATAICNVRFDNTLATGIIKAYLNEADAALIKTAVGVGGTVYADIVRTSATSWDEQLAEITGTFLDVVTGAAT